MAAIRAREFGVKVLIVDKAKISKSGCSPFAAGIYNAVLPEDDPMLWAKEVIEAGDFLNDQEWVRRHAQLSHPIITLIDGWGKEHNLTIFERDSKGRFIRRKSRGHIYSSHCVVNSLPMMEALRRQAKEKQVQFLERTMVTDLVKANGAIVGALGLNCRTGHIYELTAKSTVLAAGGCGFKSIFIGHKNLTGDLKAAALRAGAIFKSMEQFESNTCYKGFDIHGMNLMINVGGRFINSLGEEFMPKYNPKLGNRALLSELALAFCQEVKAGRGPIYLDVTGASLENQRLCRKILPQSFKAWDRAGIDPFAAKLEWVPAFYGTIAISGGLDIDLSCRTNLERLYAAGDMTYVPSGGSGLGGIPLSFASISGYKAGEAAGQAACSEKGGCAMPDLWQEKAEQLVQPILRTKGLSPDEFIYRLQRLLVSYPVCYIKSEERLKQALKDLGELKEQTDNLHATNLHELVKANEAKSMVPVAEAFLHSSLLRQESRGFHFREDFPLTNNRDWLKWIMLKQEDGRFQLWTEDIPTRLVSPEEDFTRARGTRIEE